MIKFRENFDEILDYHYQTSKAKNKDKLYEIIKEHKHLVFVNKFPVFSTVLRPALMMNESLVFDEINNLYNSVVHNSNLLKETTDVEKTDINVLPILLNIQMFVNQIYEKTLENIKGKTGFIRGNMLGSRINFSARNVITPLPAGYEIDDIVLPYLTFLELYKFQILNILVSIKNISYSKANQIWHEASTHFDEEVYSIMKQIITKTKGGCKVLLNRNPTI